MKFTRYFPVICVLFRSIFGCEGYTNLSERVDFILTEKSNNIHNSLTGDTITFKGDKKNIDMKMKYSEDGLLNFTGLAKKFIGDAEEYDVTTEDGYILKLFHIAGNESNIVLLSHGMLSTADDFLDRGNISLIYMLAKQGFDIWAMNFRGSRYCRNHVTLNPDIDKEFWQYSMHEMGLYDFKAVINFILDKTGQERMSVVAHSQGASAFFILMTENPEYIMRIKVFTGLAPACYLRHTGPILIALLKLQPILSSIAETLFIEEILGYSTLMKKVIDNLCTRGTLGYILCFKIISALLIGFNPNNIEQEFISTLLGHAPAGSSKKNFEHYADVYRLNRFCQYDYGANNYAKYGSVSPPNYDLKKVTVNTALFASKGDQVVGIEDVERLRRDLPNIVYYHVVSDDNFQHIDYVWSRYAHNILYPRVIDILNKQSKDD